jgi:predicted RNA-binding protein with RPS1 domain
MTTDEQVPTSDPGVNDSTPAEPTATDVAIEMAEGSPSQQATQQIPSVHPEGPATEALAAAENLPTPPEPNQESRVDLDVPSQPVSTEEAALPAAETPSPASFEPQSTPPLAETRSEGIQIVEDDNAKDLFEREMEALAMSEEGSTEDPRLRRLSKGERITARVIQVDRDRVFVDLGTKSEGVVPIEELTTHSISQASDAVKVGDEIQVVVMKPESGDRQAVVSKRQADFEELWDRLERQSVDQTTIQAMVVERVKGGLVVDIGVRGFVPSTHVGLMPGGNLDRYVGTELALKILEVDRDRKKVVLSNRKAAEQERQAAKDRIFTELEPGARLPGVVRRLTDYGAFVDIGGVDGLLHISEMGWSRVGHPSEVLKEGQEIEVMILKMEPEKGKISLGYRQVLPDPWKEIAKNYTVGQRITCTIGRITLNGAFVRLPEGVEAFLPASEVSGKRLKHPSEAINEGEDYELEILEINADSRKCILSLRAARGEPSFRRDDQRGPYPPSGGGSYDRGRGKFDKKPGRRRRDEEDGDGARTSQIRGGASITTIGDRLGALRGVFRQSDEGGEEVAGTAPKKPAAEPKVKAQAEAVEAPSEQPVETAPAAAPEVNAQAEVVEAPTEQPVEAAPSPEPEVQAEVEVAEVQAVEAEAPAEPTDAQESNDATTSETEEPTA